MVLGQFYSFSTSNCSNSKSYIFAQELLSLYLKGGFRKIFFVLSSHGIFRQFIGPTTRFTKFTNIVPEGSYEKNDNILWKPPFICREVCQIKQIVTCFNSVLNMGPHLLKLTQGFHRAIFALVLPVDWYSIWTYIFSIIKNSRFYKRTRIYNLRHCSMYHFVKYEPILFSEGDWWYIVHSPKS